MKNKEINKIIKESFNKFYIFIDSDEGYNIFHKKCWKLARMHIQVLENEIKQKIRKLEDSA